jgi:hypothetical protein
VRTYQTFLRVLYFPLHQLALHQETRSWKAEMSVKLETLLADIAELRNSAKFQLREPSKEFQVGWLQCNFIDMRAAQALPVEITFPHNFEWFWGIGPTGIVRKSKKRTGKSSRCCASNKTAKDRVV